MSMNHHDKADERDITPDEFVEIEVIEAFDAYQELGFFTSISPVHVVRMAVRYYRTNDQIDHLEEIRSVAMEISDWVQAIERELMEDLNDERI